MSTLRDAADAQQARPPGYEHARQRLEKQRKFRSDLFAYVVINAFLVVAWAAAGAGYFWPGWVLGGWGVLLILDGWNAFYRQPVTDADVEEELRRRR